MKYGAVKAAALWTLGCYSVLAQHNPGDKPPALLLSVAGGEGSQDAVFEWESQAWGAMGVLGGRPRTLGHASTTLLQHATCSGAKYRVGAFAVRGHGALPSTHSTGAPLRNTHPTLTPLHPPSPAPSRPRSPGTCDSRSSPRSSQQLRAARSGRRERPRREVEAFAWGHPPPRCLPAAPRPPPALGSAEKGAPGLRWGYPAPSLRRHLGQRDEGCWGGCPRLCRRS